MNHDKRRGSFSGRTSWVSIRLSPVPPSCSPSPNPSSSQSEPSGEGRGGVAEVARVGSTAHIPQ